MLFFASIRSGFCKEIVIFIEKGTEIPIIIIIKNLPYISMLK